ncbi:MAG: DUF2207 domain-containing protein [Candidatus Latescibacterota bacterium]|nr:MAG: DUF2207 domain-containing protein [Candidatus Latescibacterota bacterium]
MSRLLFSIGILVVLVGAVLTPCQAKTFRIERIHVDAQVHPDGSMDVTESITYLFDGEFAFAYRDIPLKPAERLSGLSVSDDANRFVEAIDERPGTYSMSQTDGVTRITWYYRAKDQRKTFSLGYTIYNVVNRYNDTAELYHQFVGPDWDRPIGEVSVRVRMPEGVRQSDLRAWAHGPLHGFVEIGSSSVMLDVSPLPPRTFWEARVLFPPDVFAGVELSPGGDRLAAILAEEAAWAQEANATREARRQRTAAEAERARERAALAGKLLPMSVLLGLFGLGVWFVLFRRHGWPHATRARVAPGEIPSDHHPAVLSYLMSRTVSGPAIVATLVDLANRGYLEIHQTEKISRNWLGKEKSATDYRFETMAKQTGGLEAYEKNLLEFMLAAEGDPRSFTMSGIKEAASKNSSTFRKWFRDWTKSVSDHCQTLEFFEPYPVVAMVLNALCGVIIIGIGVLVCVKTDSAAGLPAIVGGFVQAVLTVFLTRRTAEGRRLHQEWRQFKNHLQKIGKALGPVTLDSSSWAAYLASAIVFGMHKKLVPKLQLIDDSGKVVFPVWFYGVHGSTAMDAAVFDQGFANLASGFSSMVESVTTTVSSASGAGGGASAGGGGGSGGGGGGAG